MKLRVKVTQVLRVERSTIVEIEAADIEDAIEAISAGEIDLPSAADNGGVWTIDRSSLENEEYLPAPMSVGGTLTTILTGGDAR